MLAIVTSLAVGSVSMIYPFLLMIAGSSKSNYDTTEFSIIPAFYRSAATLYGKHLEGLFNEKTEWMNMIYDNDTMSFKHVELPAAQNGKLTKEWEDFIKSSQLPPYSYAIGYINTPASKTKPQTLREFKKHIAKKYGKDIAEVNKKLGSGFVSWNSFSLSPDYCFENSRMPKKDKLTEELWSFKQKQPIGNRYYFMIEGFYKKLFLKTKYGKDISEYNKKNGTNYASYKDIHLPRVAPKENKRGRADWLEFVRATLNPLWIRLDKKALPSYRKYLKAKYKSIESYNKNYDSKFASFDNVPLVKEVAFKGAMLRDFVDFLGGWTDPETGKIYIAANDSLRIHCVDFMFRDYLKNKYKNIASANKELGTSFNKFNQIFPPQLDSHYKAFEKNKTSLRWEFALRNFITVIDYLVFQGRGVLNTIIYCGLMVGIALIVNPLAAYALSRFKMPSTYKILLFLMLTMAFPPMVTQIPVFLLMKKLGLLNTFAALILPGVANGYSIFLLKGFFDSLPQELYESASLDGASEWTMFWVITMNLSKPILAVIALNAFTLAYSNFMFALLLCQDEKMWTLMVWIYQLQQMSGQGVIYASLLIAAVPTFIIFVFCQNIIMRGIVVPTEK